MIFNTSLFLWSPCAVPRIIFIGFFFVLGVVGLLSPFEYNVLPANFLFESCLFLSSVFLLRRCDPKALLFALAALLYISSCAFIALYLEEVHVLDFLQAYKAFFYIVPLAFFVRRQIFSAEVLVSLLYALLIFFFIKYAYSRFLDLTPRMGERPGLFEENNFELVFLLLLYYLVSRLKFLSFSVFIFLSLIVFLSGSRSAFLGLVVVYCFVFLRKINFHFFISVLLFPVLFFLGAWLFVDRMDGGIESIDRFKFMLVFLKETDGWGLLNYLFGSMPLTPLSVQSCEALAYYSSLFSFSGDGSCYSVILHSYFFRVIFDHGLLGFLFLLCFYWVGLRRSGFKTADVLCVYGVLFSSALSVSSFNSIFTAMVLAVFFSAYTVDKIGGCDD